MLTFDLDFKFFGLEKMAALLAIAVHTPHTVVALY